jgi:hypothetical protein
MSAREARLSQSFPRFDFSRAYGRSLGYAWWGLGTRVSGRKRSPLPLSSLSSTTSNSTPSRRTSHIPWFVRQSPQVGDGVDGETSASTVHARTRWRSRTASGSLPRPGARAVRRSTTRAPARRGSARIADRGRTRSRRYSCLQYLYIQRARGSAALAQTTTQRAPAARHHIAIARIASGALTFSGAQFRRMSGSSCLAGRCGCGSAWGGPRRSSCVAQGEPGPQAVCSRARTLRL